MNKEDLKIDLLSLEQEWLRQSVLFSDAADAASELLHEKDVEKDNLDRLRATIDLDARKNPGKYGLEKVTDKAIASILLLNTEIITQQTLVLDLIHSYNLVLNHAKALEMKKKALEKLVDLFQAQYYSVPKQKSITEDNNIEKKGFKKASTRQTRILNRDKIEIKENK